MSNTPGAPDIRPDGLQLVEQTRFQEKFWKVERYAWVIFACLLVAAGAGLFGGGGPLSRVLVKGQNYVLDMPGIMRSDTSQSLNFVQSGPSLQITLGQNFGQYFRIEDIRPRPTSWRSDNGETLSFEGAATPTRVIIHVRALGPGIVRAPIAIQGHSIPTTSIILP